MTCPEHGFSPSVLSHEMRLNYISILCCFSVALPHRPSSAPLSLTLPISPKRLLIGPLGILPPCFSYSRILGLANLKEHIVHTLAFPFPDEYDDKQPLTSKEEEERRIAEMGRPILGEHTKLEVIIEESYEFKVSLSTLPAP